MILHKQNNLILMTSFQHPYRMASSGLQEMFCSTIPLGVDDTSLMCTWGFCCHCWFLALSSGLVNKTLSHIWQVILTNVPTESGIVDYVDGFSDDSSKVVSLPAICCGLFLTDSYIWVKVPLDFP